MIEEVDLECATCGTVVPHTGNGITAVCSACDTVTHPESPSVPRVRVNDPCPKCAVDRRHLVHRCGLCLFCGENLDKQDHHDCDRRGQSSRDIVVARTRVERERELRDVTDQVEMLTGKDFLLYVSRPGDGRVRYVFQGHVAIGLAKALVYAYYILGTLHAGQTGKAIDREPSAHESVTSPAERARIYFGEARDV